MPTLAPDLHHTLRDARALHRQGRIEQARDLYHAVLLAHPRQFDALHSLGMIAAQSGDSRTAIELISEAIEVDSHNAWAFFNRGSVLQATRQLEAALADYERAIAIKADFVEAHNNLGVVFGELKRVQAALDSCGTAAELNPNFAAAHFNRGNFYGELGQWENALRAYDRAIEIDPHYAAACANRGLLHYELKQYHAALEDFERALAVGGNDARLQCLRGDTLAALSQPVAALAGYETAISIDPDYAIAHCSRGNTLVAIGDFHAAVASYDKALSLNEDYIEAYCNRANALSDLNLFEDAVRDYDRALALNPQLAAAHNYKAYALLCLGDFKRGWAEYEWRWKNEHGPSMHQLRHFPQPFWRGDAPIAGKTMLLWCEQGYGDSIQFCRYAPLLVGLGARVIMEVPAPLRDLFASLRGVAQIVAEGEPLPVFDYHCSLLSLPLALGTTLDGVPADIPYLRSTPGRLAEWRDRLGARTRPRVGIAWSGGVRPERPELRAVHERRNIPLEKFAVVKNSNVEFYSLQKGAPAESEPARLSAAGWNGPRLIDHTSLLNDFADTAALLENMDLVITVDTSMAHLAGAIGKPVWILNRFDTCWRWLLQRTDSPWYPTARLYRQESPGDWDSVLQRVAKDLRRFQ